LNFVNNLTNQLIKAKNILDFYIRSNLHVGLAAGCLTWITLYNWGFRNSWIILFVIASTVLSYNFIRLQRKNELAYPYQNWMKRNSKIISSALIINVILVLLLSFQLRFSALMILIPSVMITFFYAAKISGKNRFTLREVRGIKIVAIALVWALVTVFFPLLQEQVSFDNNAWITFVQRFLFVFAITIPFDIRDLHLDQKEIKTLPLMFGTQLAKYLGYGALFVFILLELGKTKDHQNMLVTILIAIISSFFLYKSETENQKYFFSFWVESIPIIWLLLTLFL
jgi:hypothetical protein